jgi:hypothetical protein
VSGSAPASNPGVTSDANISGAVAGDEVEYFPWALNDNDQLILKVHQKSELFRLLLCTWRLHCGDSIVSTLLFQLWPLLAHLKADPEELSREGFSGCFLSLRSFLG